MNPYELIMVFDTALGEEKINALVAKIEDKIKAGGGAVEKVDRWGTRKLASMMKKAKKLTQGYYVLVNFSSAPSLPAELRAFLKVTESVVRYFLSRASEIPAVSETEAPAAAGAAAAVAAGAVDVGEIKGEPLGQP